MRDALPDRQDFLAGLRSIRLSTTLLFFARLLALLAALALVKLSIDQPVSAIQAGGIALILLIAAFTRRSRFSLLAMGYVGVLLLHVRLRALADETFIPVHFDYPIFLERLLFVGGIPTTWLQDLLYTSGRITPFDALMAVTYLSFLAAPHVAAIVIWKTRPSFFPRVACAILLTFLAGLAIYFLLPTAPPWLASEEGLIDPAARRLMPEIVAVASDRAYQEGATVVDGNHVAAMPSLHMALTVTVAMIMAIFGPKWRRAGFVYIGLMAVALVYLGEHYVVDELAGVAVALAVWRLVFPPGAKRRIDETAQPVNAATTPAS